MDDVSQISAEHAERVVVGSVLQAPEILDEVLAVVQSEDFGSYPCRLVFETVCRLREASQPIGAAEVLMALSSEGKSKDLTPRNAEFLAGLLDVAGVGASWGFAADRVRDAATRRRLIRIASALMTEAADPSETADEIAGRFRQQLASIADGQAGSDDPVSLATAMTDAIDRYDAAAAGRRVNPAVLTELQRLDQVIGGLAPQSLYVLAARPSVGKSALALRLAEGAARQGAGVLVFSLEMSTTENVDRLVSTNAGVPLPRLRGDVPMTHEQHERVGKLYDHDGPIRLPIWFVDRPGLSTNRICNITRRWVHQKGIKIVIIDYVQLIKALNTRDPRHLQVGQISQQLKELAKSEKIAVVTCAQLNREVESRADGKPKLSDLRDSGQIEQDADVIMLIHRIEDDERLQEHRVDLLVAKNRNGPTGTVPLVYHRPFVRFEERVPCV